MKFLLLHSEEKTEHGVTDLPGDNVVVTSPQPSNERQQPDSKRGSSPPAAVLGGSPVQAILGDSPKQAALEGSPVQTVLEPPSQEHERDRRGRAPAEILDEDLNDDDVYAHSQTLLEIISPTTGASKHSFQPPISPIRVFPAQRVIDNEDPLRHA